MEVINNFKDFKPLDFQKHAGIYKDTRERVIYKKKDGVVRLYDEDNVIKKTGNNIEYLQKLSSLNIKGVNSPNKICINGKIPGYYYIVSKYLKDAIELEYFERKTKSFEEILIIFIKLLEILEECHDNDFYLYDIHSGNVLVNSNLEPCFFDFDNSLFISENKTIFESKSSSFSDCMRYNETRECFTRCFGPLDGLESFYNSNASILTNFFQQFDKEYLLKMLLDMMYVRMGYDINAYCDLDKNDIKKLGISRAFRNKLINVFVNGEPFDEKEYFIDELKEMQGSRLVRKLRR